MNSVPEKGKKKKSFFIVFAFAFAIVPVTDLKNRRKNKFALNR